ncbi:MAG: hypothetical protein WA208_05420 [Thermoanaerobaculia bacterium]
MRKGVAVALSTFVLGILLGVGFAAAAQSSGPEAQPTINSTLALRVEGERDGRLIGTLVAQVDGKWVEVEATWTGPIISVPPDTDLQPKPKFKLLKP